MPSSEPQTPKNGQISFGKKFYEWPDKKKIGYLTTLCSSQNHALDLMQQERNALRDQVSAMEQQVANAQSALDIQKGVVRSLVDKTNQESQGVAERIHELETRVKAQDKVIEGFNGNKH